MCKKSLPPLQTYQSLRQDIVPLLRSRHSQYLMPFSFWPEVYARREPHIYELRSYHLKPGTMVEWGNYWARAIRMRDKRDHPTAYMGTFSQVGKLGTLKYCIHDRFERTFDSLLLNGICLFRCQYDSALAG